MSYSLHNFQSRDVLYASDLNEMDIQIAKNEEILESAFEVPINVWSEGDVTFTKNSGNIQLSQQLEAGATYTFFANVESNDTYSSDCRVYLVQEDGTSGTYYFLIERGTEKSATISVPTNGLVYDKLLLLASRTSAQSDGDTATFSNIRFIKGNYLGNYPPPSAIDRVMRDRMKYGQQTKWLALGDSITAGVYSFVNNSDTQEAKGTGWVQRVAENLGYQLTVLGSRGMGYTEAVTGQDPSNVSQRISLNTLLTRAVALTDEFNLITLAFGVNDYNTPSQASLDTIATGLNNAIYQLATRWPAARIVVITPFNCCNTEGCTFETNWNCKFSRGNPGRTLADVAHKIEDCCNAVGVECLNCTENFVLNAYNISKDLPNDVRLLPDKVHPSIAGHILIAKAMIHKLIF